MTFLATRLEELAELLDEQDRVLSTRTALNYMTTTELRWRVESGRWQQPCRGVIVASSGELVQQQKLRVAVLWGGPGAALSGLTAARLYGLRGFDRDTELIHLVRPGSHVKRSDRPAFDIAVHYSRKLRYNDIHPVRQPTQTRAARSLVDAALWMGGDRGAQAVLAAGVQQQLVRVSDLRAVTDEYTRLPRGELIRSTLADIEGGCQALSELDFMREVVRAFGLPQPDRQVQRDDGGKRRWLDAVWENAKVVVEIDGAAHADVLQYWDDMERDRRLKLAGYTVLRFPSFMVRYFPGEVAAQIRKALRNAGIRC